MGRLLFSDFDLRTRAADALFVVQLIGMVALMVPMMIRNLTEVQGLSMSFFLILLIFTGLQMSIAVGAHRAEATRKSLQALIMYSVILLLVGVHACEVVLLSGYEWDLNDAVTLGLTGLGATLVYGWRRSKGSTFQDPITKSQIAMTTRGIPQLLQGLKIALVGGAGWSGVSVLMGNMNIWTRIAHLVLTQGEAEWDANRRWMLASEIVNALTWFAVSAIWFAQRVAWFVPLGKGSLSWMW